MIIAILVTLGLFGNAMQMQERYDHCKEKQFEGKYCKFPKKLKQLGE